jgi:hypothetical protein
MLRLTFWVPLVDYGIEKGLKVTRGFVLKTISVQVEPANVEGHVPKVLDPPLQAAEVH